MNFLNPLALIGLAAASIPVIIHLLNLRKLKTIEFSSLRFLKELQKTKIKKLKMKQLLLLILRTLLIIFAVFAFARPTVESSLPLMGQYAKSSSIILLDNSFSMDVSDELGNRFNKAKSQAINIIESMKEGDELAIIPLASLESKQDIIWSRNSSFLREELSKINISYKKADLTGALAIAQNMFENSVNLNKQCFIISEFQPNVLYRSQMDSLKYFDGSVVVYAIRSGGESKGLRNLSVDSLYIRSRIFRKGKNVELEAYIKNNNDIEVNGAIASLYFNNKRVAQRTLDLNPNEIKMLEISAPVENQGFVTARVELEPDILDPDNRRYFGFIVSESPKIALAGNSNEMKFVELALGLTTENSESSNKPNVSYINPSAVGVGNYDVVFYSLSNIDSRALSSIKDYVTKGGSALLFASENSTDQTTKVLQEFGFGKTETKEFNKSNPIRFNSIDKIHPLFEGVFKGTTNRKEIVESPNIYKVMPVSGGQKIIETPAGAFLSEVRYGKGRILYCAVSPDLKWSDMPVTGFFPTLIYRSTYYLSSKEEYGNDTEVGEKARIEIPAIYSDEVNFKVIDPNEKEFFVKQVSLPQSAFIDLPMLNLPGGYKIYDPNGMPLSTISVNVLRSESYVISLSNDDISDNISAYISGENNVLYYDRELNISEIIEESKTGTELWQLFLVLSIITALFEMLVARNKKEF